MLLALSSQAAFGAVFLNGVNIDGVVNQTFEGCTVKIDDKGNVLITAKGYQVQASTPTPAATAAAPAEPVTKQYFLVSDMTKDGAQYDVDVFINSVWVKRVAANDNQVILDISKHLHKGKNTVHMTAVKNLKEGRKSVSPSDWLKLHIGEGSVAGNNVMIDNPLLEYTRTAAETQTFENEYPITGR
jgi:hypothetical protein